MNRIYSFVFLFFITIAAKSQDVDSTNRRDSLPVIKDTAVIAPDPVTTVTKDSFSLRPRLDPRWNTSPDSMHSLQSIISQVAGHHPWLGFSSQPVSVYSPLRQFKGKEAYFYGFVLLLMFFAILKRAFPKYFNDLFRLFFRTTLKQRQLREQLMQTPLPSLLMNAFFIITAAFYISLVLRHYHLNPVANFWLMSLYCCLGLAIAYFVKFIGLKLSGWLFNMREAADAYIFIVFIVNKMIGIMLLPFVILLAFTEGKLYTISLSASFVLVAGLLAYRFILTFAAIRNQVKVNPFHFFLYLCAFEIAPLLLVYKGLLHYLQQTA